MEKTTDKTARAVLVTLAVVAAILGSLWLLGRNHSNGAVFFQALHMSRLAQQAGEALHAAAQAEKQAVMADTDESSALYASQARNATARVEELLRELKDQPNITQEERARIDRFAASFAEYRRVDEEVLGLAVQNTNLKAFALSFDQAATTLSEMEKSLRPLLDGANDKAARRAQRALSETLRIQSLHAAHIMEKTDPRMNALEKHMAEADKAVRSALASLGGEGASALAAYERYSTLTGEIVALSRQNTNVRSFSMSLERKTRVLAACDEALRVLEENIRERMASKATR